LQKQSQLHTSIVALVIQCPIPSGRLELFLLAAVGAIAVTCIPEHISNTIPPILGSQDPGTFDAFHFRIFDRIAATIGGRLLVICNIPKTHPSLCPRGANAGKQNLVKGAKGVTEVKIWV